MFETAFGLTLDNIWLTIAINCMWLAHTP